MSTDLILVEECEEGETEAAEADEAKVVVANLLDDRRRHFHTWDRCYDFKNIFAPKNAEKIGGFLF
jgi:hypothetical protein